MQPIQHDSSSLSKTRSHERTCFHILYNKKILLVVMLCIQAPILYCFYESELARVTKEYVVQSLEDTFQASSKNQDSLSNDTLKLQFINKSGSEIVPIISETKSMVSNEPLVNDLPENLKKKTSTIHLITTPSHPSSAIEKHDQTITTNNKTINNDQNTNLNTSNNKDVKNPAKQDIKNSNNAVKNSNSVDSKDVTPHHASSSQFTVSQTKTVSSDTKHVNEITEHKSGDVKVLPKCPKTPPGLQGNLFVSFSKAPMSFQEIKEDNPLVLPGGFFKPSFCIANSKVAIIIPFRDRDAHLQYFLQYMHPTLRRQQLEYRIYIINQNGKGKFNRAKLMNIGYAESIKDNDFGCFVFHDVDLILENDNALYSCPDKPRHLSSAVDKFNYRLPYQSIFGGVTELSKEQFVKVNGFSNSFWGWGGEDDDMYTRIRTKHMTISRYPIDISRYRMISHKREKGNESNPKRFKMIRETAFTMANDGLNNLKYDIISRDVNPLYTNITVELHGPS